MNEEQIMQANKGGYFKLHGKVYKITGVYGRCFQCYEVEVATETFIGAECLISARMILGMVELSKFVE